MDFIIERQAPGVGATPQAQREGMIANSEEQLVTMRNELECRAIKSHQSRLKHSTTLRKNSLLICRVADSRAIDR